MVSFYVNDDSQMVSYDFGLNRTQFWNAGDGIYYSHGWEFNMEDVQLTIVPSLDDQEVSLPFRFYEGSCKIKGTVDGDSVTGVAFAELLHHYQIPQVEIIYPVNGDTLSDNIQVVSWSLLNPDDGNPLFYSLSYSLNNDSIFVPIVSGIEDTFYIWDISGLPVSDNYRLQLIGYSVDSTLVGVDTTKFSISGISENITPISNRFKLYRNYPNPFSSMTMISYQLPVKSEFSLKIYDLTGRLIKTLVNDEIETGYYTVGWDGIDSSGKRAVSGVYFYRLQAGNCTATKKMCLVR